jgi:hypothetical protein
MPTIGAWSEGFCPSALAGRSRRLCHICQRVRGQDVIQPQVVILWESQRAVYDRFPHSIIIFCPALARRRFPLQQSAAFGTPQLATLVAAPDQKFLDLGIGIAVARFLATALRTTYCISERRHRAGHIADSAELSYIGQCVSRLDSTATIRLARRHSGICPSYARRNPCICLP